MLAERKILVVGADSLIGAQLLQQAGVRTRGTSRRDGNSQYLHLDLSMPNCVAGLAETYDVAILCAAVSQHDRCAGDPRTAYAVNVQGPVALARALMQRGIHVVFLSTDSVFGETNVARGESDSINPGSHIYPALKAEAEALLLETARDDGYSDRLAIVRLTKVVSARRDPFATWCATLHTGGPIEPLSDLILAPISLMYAVQGLMQIATGRQHGIFHLSAQRDLSYAGLARRIAGAVQHEDVVLSRSAMQADVQPSYKPMHSALDMRRTRDLTGLQPQPVDKVVTDLWAEFHTLRCVPRAIACDIAA